MGKTTFSGPVNSLAGFEVAGEPLATDGSSLLTSAVIVSEGEAITIPAGTSLDAALKIIADAVDPD